MEQFLWDEFCDWYLEIAKIRLRGNDEASPLPVLVHVLDTCLRLLHPYMPYVTEEIWSGSGALKAHLAQATTGLLIKADYPAPGQAWRDEDAEREMSLVLDIVRAVRNIRRERGLDASRWLEAYVVADASIAKHAPAIEALARVRPVHIVAHQSHAPSESVATAILADAQVVLPLTGLIDRDAERAKLEKEREQARGQVEALERQLRNDKFLSGARAEIIDGARQRLDDAHSRLTGIEARLAELG
jgi:valyl-tRNA synthetase